MATVKNVASFFSSKSDIDDTNFELILMSCSCSIGQFLNNILN